MLGDGEIQNIIKVTSMTPIETYVISVEDFSKFGDPEITRLYKHVNNQGFNLNEKD